MNTKTVFISECERDHILSGLRTGFEVTQKDYYGSGPNNDLFVVLDKLGLLNKNLKNMERSDILKYECLRKKMKELRCNAKQLLQSDDISIEEMRAIIRNLNIISRKMKEMSKKLGTDRFKIDELSESEGSDHSHISIRKNKKKVVSPPEPKKKIVSDPEPVNKGAKSSKYEEVKKRPKVVNSKSSKQKPTKGQNTDRGGTKCVSQSRIADIFSKDDCSVSTESRNREPKDVPIGSYITKYSKSNDHQHHCYEGLVLETCSKCLCRRWSIPSVNRTSLKTYIKNNIKNTGPRPAANSASLKDCSHSGCKGSQSSKKDDFVPLPGLVPNERKHLTEVRNKILKDNACKSGSDLLSKNSSIGCCFNSNTDLEVFETSDTSLNKNEDAWDSIFDSCAMEYKGENFQGGNATEVTGEKPVTSVVTGEKPVTSVVTVEKPVTSVVTGEKPVTSVDGTTQWDGETDYKSNITNIRPRNYKEAALSNEELRRDVCKCQSTETDVSTNKKCTDRADKCVQSACIKVNQCTSYDNFILHPQFSWSMPMVGQAFRRSVPLPQEKWRYFDKRGNFIPPCKPSADTGTTTKKPKHILVMDKSVQTNDMLFTKNMHQVMYLNVVYTKTHIRYIIPNSMEIPVLSHTPEVIERRAIDNGYAVTTYKADPDGVIHFTLAYSDGDECKRGSNDLPEEANRRLCQLKNLWISSAQKFFSQLNEKLVGESGDCEEHHRWPNSLNCSSSYASSSVTQSEASDASIKTNDTEC